MAAVRGRALDPAGQAFLAPMGWPSAGPDPQVWDNPLFNLEGESGQGIPAPTTSKAGKKVIEDQTKNEKISLRKSLTGK